MKNKRLDKIGIVKTCLNTTHFFSPYLGPSRLLVLLLFTGLLMHLPASAQKDVKYIREGNKQYKDNNFDEAEIEYRRAMDANEASEKAVYNLGAALYKQDKYEEAGKIYNELAATGKDKETLARYYHNLGNAHFKANEFQKSIEAYKKSLLNNPESEDTRYNLAYAQRKLQQQQQEQEQNKNQDQKNEQNQDQKNQQEQQEQEQQQKEEEQQQQQQQQENQEEKEEQQQQQQQQMQRPEISEEDARRLLEALEDNEKEVQEKVKKELAKSKRVKTDKNW